ncbi:hypothetical protein ACI2OX_13955 [Bacillus sp. N9]
MIYSSSMVMAVQYYGYPANFFYEKQKMNLIMAFTAFLFFAIFPYKAYRNKNFLFSLRQRL